MRDSWLLEDVSEVCEVDGGVWVKSRRCHLRIRILLPISGQAGLKEQVEIGQRNCVVHDERFVEEGVLMDVAGIELICPMNLIYTQEDHVGSPGWVTVVEDPVPSSEILLDPI